jgi:hypothetical protein
LVGELGLGKSLRLERWHQQSIIDALENAASPIPVYIEAGTDITDLEDAIDRHAAGIGDWREVGVALALDRLERAGPTAAEELLKASRRLVTSHTRSLVLSASRPMSLLQIDEAVQAEELTNEDAVALVARFASHFNSFATHDWPKSLQAAIRRPLFAILVGIDIVERPYGKRDRWVPSSLGSSRPRLEIIPLATLCCCGDWRQNAWMQGTQASGSATSAHRRQSERF